jgi:hypothetical protein
MPLSPASPVLGLFLLGALHGINPGMGWLFAVARGFQERKQRAVWGALAPLAVGHGLAIAAAFAAAAMIGVVLPLSLVQTLVGVALVVSGLAGLYRHRHPRGGGMRMGAPALAAWSFMMATAHGAGLMALPLVLAGPPLSGGMGTHAMHVAQAGPQWAGGPALHLTGVVATVVHAAGYLLVTALIAVIVYQRVGLRMLRTAWINLDLFWGLALVITGVATLLG